MNNKKSDLTKEAKEFKIYNYMHPYSLEELCQFF